MEQLKITISQAARLIGRGEIYIREAMKRELLPIGFAMETGGETRKWSFFISPKEFADYMGITTEQLWERIRAMEE